MIQNSVDSSKQLTIHTCSGIILAEDLRETVTTLYASEPTPHHLWDFTNADLSSISGQALKDVAQLAKQLAPSRVGSRTAIVAPSDFAFGLGRMYEAFAGFTDQGVELKIFRSRNEAEEWLGVNPA